MSAAEALEVPDFASRRDLYAFCARMLGSEIDAPLYDTLTSEQMKQLWSELELTFVEEELVAAGRDAAIEALATEFCRLFIGPLPACVPYESTQREDALLGGKARRRIEELAETFGLELHLNGAVASSDHVAVELSMLAQLYGVAADPSATSDERHHALAGVHRLLGEHLLQWAPRYFAQLALSAERDAYRATAAVASNLLEEERSIHRL